MPDPIVLVTKADDAAVLPEYANAGDAGAVLRALEPVELRSGECAAVRTGLAIALPDGFAGLIQQSVPEVTSQPPPFSVVPSVVDAGFRGEISVLANNPHPSRAVKIGAGQPIARLVIVPIMRASFAAAEKLPGSVRQ